MELHSVIARRVMANVARIRKERDLSQHQFADIVGISRPYLTQLEAGLRDPSLETVCKFATTLGVDLSVLLEK